jgi:UDP-N-acetylglucosamine 2-epimerase (non-hydrolysing)
VIELEEAGLSSMLSTNGTGEEVILVTAHRRENHGAPLEEICNAVKDLALQYSDRIKIVYPVHLNPNVQEPAYRILGDLPNVWLPPPLGYQALVYLLKRTAIVLTDSGGLQEEAPGLGVPVLVLRETTERPEGIDAGTVKLVGANRNDIVRETRRLLEDRSAYESMAAAVNPYGDGKASRRIVNALLQVESSVESL